MGSERDVEMKTASLEDIKDKERELRSLGWLCIISVLSHVVYIGRSDMLPKWGSYKSLAICGSGVLAIIH